MGLCILKVDSGVIRLCSSTAQGFSVLHVLVLWESATPYRCKVVLVGERAMKNLLPRIPHCSSLSAAQKQSWMLLPECHSAASAISKWQRCTSKEINNQATYRYSLHFFTCSILHMSTSFIGQEFDWLVFTLSHFIVVFVMHTCCAKTEIIIKISVRAFSVVYHA